MKPGPRNILIGIVVVLVVIAGVIYFVPSWRTTLLDWWGNAAAPAPVGVPFPLYENGTYQWYSISDSTVTATPAVGLAGIATFPSGSTIAVTDKGLVWNSAEQKSTNILINRTGLTPESSVVAPNGTAAVLFNQDTNAFDVFSITYEGAYVSYIDSIPMPVAPSYLISIGIASPNLLIVHTGNPDSFELYRIGEGSVMRAGTATLTTAK